MHRDPRPESRDPLPRSSSALVRRGLIPFFRVGRTLVTVHTSFAAVVVLAAAIGWMQYGGWIGALFNSLAVILLCASVLIHELAHAAVAVRYGIDVHEITLLPFGGVANIEAAVIRPAQEVRIALAGPVANLLLGALLLASVSLHAWLTASPLPRDLTTLWQSPSFIALITYLIAANILLGIFNLLPVFPLDGGRAMRGLLARWGRPDRATQIVGAFSLVVGSVTLALAIAFIIQGGWLYGLVLLALGGAMLDGAWNERRAARSRTVMERWTAGELARPADLTAMPHDPLTNTINAITLGQVVPVVADSDQRLIGLITNADLRNRPGRIGDLTVAHVMRTRFPTVRSSDPLWVAFQKLKLWNLYAIPVVNHLHPEQLEGMLTLAAIQHVLRHYP